MPVAPRVAVVVPTYQRSATIERAVRSVLAQEGLPFEVIVVDDGSTDSTAERLATLRDPRLRVVHQANAGRSAARNAGARVATAPVLTFLDSDDEALPGWLAEIDRLVDPDTCPVVRLALLVARGGGSPQRRPAGGLDPRRPFPEGARQPGSWAVATRLFHAVGGFDPGLGFSENTELLVRLALASGREGWSAATSDRAGVVLHTEGGDSRVGRYGSAQGDAAATLLTRYAALLRRDRRTRHDYRAIVGVHELRAGRRRSAAGQFARSWADRPLSPAAAARLLRVVLPPGARRRLSRG